MTSSTTNNNTKQNKSIGIMKRMMNLRKSKSKRNNQSQGGKGQQPKDDNTTTGATKKKHHASVLGGVYHTTTTNKDHNNDSFSTIDATSISSTENDCDTSSSCNSDRTTSCWSSSGSEDHHVGAPLLVRHSISQRHMGSLLQLSDEEVLGRILLEKTKTLPRANTDYFVSNHMMINDERTKRRMVPLKRNCVMDNIAREHASLMAKQQSLFHYDDPNELLQDKLPESDTPRNNSTRIGMNVGRGTNLDAIHYCMMKASVSDKNNIIDRRFVSMGVGTAKAVDGTVFMCQIFSD